MNKIMDNFGVFDYLETPEGTYEYTAEELRSYFAALVGNGVLKGVAGQLAASAAGLTVTLATGEAWLLGVHGVIVNPVTFVLDPVVAGMSRICSVVVDVDTINQLMGISVLVGTQAASPSDPVLTQTATRYQQLLHKARVYDNGTIVLSDCRSFVTRPGDGVDLTSIGGISFLAAQTLTAAQKAQACSNMGAAKRSVPPINVTLAAATWNNPSAGLYAIYNSNITAESAVEVLPGLSISATQLAALQAANLQDNWQGTGVIVVKAFGAVPAIDIPIRMIIRGDLY